MEKKKKMTYEYRHYELQQEFPILALLGEGWIRRIDHLDVMHFHGQLEIGYCYWGAGELFVEDKVYPFSAGTVTIIPRNVPHSTDSGGRLVKWEYLFVDIDEFLNYFSENSEWFLNSVIFPISSKAYILSRDKSPVMANMILQILDEMRFQKHHYQLSVRALIFAFFIEVGRLDVNEEISKEISKEIKLQQKSSIQIVPALEYISENYGEAIRISELADMCHLSETHFRRLFHCIMSVSPLDYINTTRIYTSCSLLRTTDDSVLSIAVKTGFSTVTTFNRNFSKVVGTTPLKWKNDPAIAEKNLKNYNIKKLEGWL